MEMNSLYADDRGADFESKWEYPSPQQFYNALMRKGWDTPEEHVEAMVAIHNRLNEDAWSEILKWESRGSRGASEAAILELSKFAGIHGELSNKARLYQIARWLFPSRFIFAPPFDRHDWVVRRPRTNKLVRYVIDYYSLRKDVNAEPDFYIDVRPALDNFGNAQARLMVGIENGLLSFGQRYSGARIGFMQSRSHCLIHGFLLLVGLALATFAIA